MNNLKLDTFILILYGAMIVFLGYRLYKSHKDKKNLQGEVEAFKKRITKMEYILFIMLLVTGAFNIINGFKESRDYDLMTGSVMVIMAIVFFFATNQKLYIAKNGLLMGGKFFTYKEIRKFGFDQERGDFVILTKVKGQENRQAAQVNQADINAINELMRKYKLGK